jgi:glycosyltransferase involved in cell wall biosynthesis
MRPLVAALNAKAIYYTMVWEQLSLRSWRVGQMVREWGKRWSGSEWFAPLPWVDECRLVRSLPRGQPSIAHYVFGDFTPPVLIDAVHRKGAKIVATFHVSARRAPQVLGGVRRLDELDAVTLVSASQRAWFLERGVPAQRLHVILHGVEAKYFVPAPRAPREGPLHLLIVGKTERDHAFAAAVMAALPKGVAMLRVMTAPEQQANYRGVAGVELLPRLDDAGLLAAYQQADLLFMPVLDCTANNAVLESMACGTSVMANRVGGIPEYVDPSCNVVMPDKRVDEWVDQIMALARNRDTLNTFRPRVRTWAERFDWRIIADQYRALYASLL